MVEVMSTTVAVGVTAVDMTRVLIETPWLGCRLPRVRTRRLSRSGGVPAKRLVKLGKMDAHTC